MKQKILNLWRSRPFLILYGLLWKIFITLYLLGIKSWHLFVATIIVAILLFLGGSFSLYFSTYQAKERKKAERYSYYLGIFLVAILGIGGYELFLA